MKSLTFGFNAVKSQPGILKPSQKRKAIFDEDNDEEPQEPSASQYGAKKSTKPLRPINSFGADDGDEKPPRKSPKISHLGVQSVKAKTAGPGVEKINLSALRSAKLHDEEASKIDSSVYDYDAVYDTFHAPAEKRTSGTGEEPAPKYMGSLLQSADVRKRDQMRAREKLLQREREAEGDEFADKEKFVTEAYKKQQEEMKRMEEEEKKREEAEEERRRKGGGMAAFHKKMLEKDEERMRLIKAAEEEAARRKDGDEKDDITAEEKSDAKIAEEMNEKGARIVLNDEGEVVDKRQLLSAGLNVAPKKPGKEQVEPRKQDSARRQEYWRSSKVQDARESQRERQTRMIERQIVEMAEKQRQAELEVEKENQEKNKSKVTEAEKMGARERFLQRKKEREAEARKKKEAGG